MLSNCIKTVLCAVLVIGPFAPESTAEGLFPRIRANIQARQNARQSARAAYSRALNSSYGTSYGSSGSSGYSYGCSGSVGRYEVIVEEVVESEGSTGGAPSYGSNGGTVTYEKQATPRYQFAPVQKVKSAVKCYINSRGQKVCPLGKVDSIEVSTQIAPLNKVEIAVVDAKAPIDTVDSPVAMK